MYRDIIVARYSHPCSRQIQFRDKSAYLWTAPSIFKLTLSDKTLLSKTEKLWTSSDYLSRVKPLLAYTFNMLNGLQMIRAAILLRSLD